MTYKAAKFVVCRTLPEMLRMSAYAINNLGTEFSVCDCHRCGQSLVIAIDAATKAATLDLEIVCPNCATPYSSLMAGVSKRN